MSGEPIGIMGPVGWRHSLDFIQIHFKAWRNGQAHPAFSYTTALGKFSFVATLGEGAFVQSHDNQQHLLPAPCIGKIVVGSGLAIPSAMPRTAAEDTLLLTGGTIPPNMAIGLGQGVLNHELLRVVLTEETNAIPEADRLDLTIARHILNQQGHIELPPDRHSR